MNELLNQIDYLLSDISVKGDDVLKMVRVRSLLKQAVSVMNVEPAKNATSKEKKNGGEQTDRATASSK